MTQVPSSKDIRLDYGGEYAQGGLQRKQSELEARLASESGAGAEGDAGMAAIRRELDVVRAEMEELRNSSTVQSIDPPPSYVARD